MDSKLSSAFERIELSLDDEFVHDLKKKLYKKIQELSKIDKDKLIDKRYKKFRKIGD